jgi:thymidylate kinase
MTLALIERMVAELNRQGIVYCHWKGNYSIDRVLSGEKDFELLVDRKSSGRVTAILLELGFRRAVVSWEERTPGVHHYYGCDEQTGQLVHVHYYICLMTGESFIKSHLLPLDTMLLEHGCRIGEIKVPVRPAELIVHTLRVFIKYGSLVDWIYLLRETRDYSAALRWLLEGDSLSEALCLLERYCPLIDAALFIECIGTLQTPTSFFKKLWVAQRVRRQLRVYERYSGFHRFLAYVFLLWQQGLRRLSGKKRNKVLHTGGAIIAFVGPEATGKSTLVSESQRWLGDVFCVKTVHAGKPPSSWLMAPVNALIPLLRRILPGFRTTRLDGNGSQANLRKSTSNGANGRSLVYALRAVVLAWDRRQLLTECWRLARQGDIVICDRYPSETVGMMDSPRLVETTGAGRLLPAIYNWLARLEHRLYAEIPPPDVVLRLNVSVETAQQRNRERIKADKEDDSYVESRHRMTQPWSRSGTRYICDMDTERSLAATILNVKQTLWELL